MFVVKTPLAHLRKRPLSLLESFEHDANRDSQLLMGDAVTLLEERGAFCYVHALFQNYKGWLLKEEILEERYHPTHVVKEKTLPLSHATLSYGSYLYSPSPGELVLPGGRRASCDPKALRALESPPCFDALCREAHLFLGAPYLWGGCASALDHQVASVDCSGLIHLLYKAQGLKIPRDVIDQYQTGKKAPSLQKGDALYLQEKERARVHHVMLYIGEERFIEAPQSGEHIRLLREGHEIKKEKGYYIIEGREGLHIGYPTSLQGAPSVYAPAR